MPIKTRLIDRVHQFQKLRLRLEGIDDFFRVFTKKQDFEVFQQS